MNDIPRHMQHLPTDEEGRPIPWFVAKIDGEYDPRVADSEKLRRAILDRLCWVCGNRLGKYSVYVIGPMCAVNRTTAEPPSHRDCAEFSVRHCPFLSSRIRKRRRKDLSPQVINAPGIPILRNPSVTVLWTTTQPIDIFRSHDDGVYDEGILFQLPDPCLVTAWSQGRRATSEEIAESINTGIPEIEKLCLDEDRLELARSVGEARRLLGVAIGDGEP